MNSSVYVHDLDPFLIQFPAFISERLPLLEGIRWYGMAYLTGFLLGYLVIYLMAKRGTIQVPKERIADFVTYVAIGTLVGGRVGYALFYSPDLLTDFGGDFPWWGVFKVYNGGMASHGGIMGIMVACLIYGWQHRVSKLHLIDLTVFGGSLGIFFGRIANFINGELYGREASDSLAWAVKFPQEMYLWANRQVAKLADVAPAAEALGEIKTRGGETLKITASAWKGWVANYKTDSGSYNAINQVLDQLILAVQQGNQAVTEALGPALTTRHPSQLYQAFLEGLFVFIILAAVWIKPRKPGVVAGWFGLSYAIARIIGEQFRMPDAHLGFQALGLTRGQWLSVAMLVAAIVWLIVCSRRTAPKLGGTPFLSQ